MFKKSALSFLLFLLVITSGFGQLSQPQRIEIPIENEDNNFNVVSSGERGIVIYREVRNRETRMERKYQIILVDSALNKVWEKMVYVHLRYIQIGFEHCDDQFYLLFQRNSESLKADLFVLRIGLDNQRIETFLIERDYALELTEFEVVGNTLIFGGYANSLPTVVTYRFGNIQAKVLSGMFTDNSKIMHLETDDELKLINLLTTQRLREGKKTLAYNTYTEEGELVKNILLRPADEKSLLFGRPVALDTDVDIIVGTYTRKRSDMSRGIFLATISPEGDQIINYYNYADLKNFFSYMKARRQRRVEERIQRRKIKGKKNKFNYHLLVHDIVEWDGRFIMVGEAFYPKYSQSTYYGGFNAYSNYANSYGMSFEGYKYTHAVVFGFDRRARLLWDNSFQIKDVLSYNLEQYVHVSMSDEEMALLYMYEDEIRSKVIEGNDVVEGKTFNEIKLSFEDEIVEEVENEYGGLEKWYAGHLFAYGKHEIKKSKAQGIDSDREVFFINKIVYQ